MDGKMPRHPFNIELKSINIFAIFVMLTFLMGCTAPSSTTSGNVAGKGITFTTSVSIGATQTIPAATSGNLYNARITPSGGEPPYSCYAAPGTSLPGELVFTEPGCSITGTAPMLPSGTPSKVFPISFIIKDSNGTAAGPFHIDLLVEETGVFFYTGEEVFDINPAMVGRPYRHSFCDPAPAGINDLCGAVNQANPSGGTPPYYFTLGTGTGFPPMGLILNPNGLLTGTPTIAGTSKFSVCAVDTVSKQACSETSLEVRESRRIILHMNGDGEGNVTDWPDDPKLLQVCYAGGNCTFYFEKGTKAAIRHHEKKGTAFAGWSGDCEGDWCSPVMDSDKDATARFERYDLAFDSLTCQYVSTSDLGSTGIMNLYNLIAKGTAKGPKGVSIGLSDNFDDATKGFSAWREALGLTKGVGQGVASTCGSWAATPTVVPDCTNEGNTGTTPWTLGYELRTFATPVTLNVTIAASPRSSDTYDNRVSISKIVTCA